MREKTLRVLILHKTIHSKTTTDFDEICERDKRLLERERKARLPRSRDIFRRHGTKDSSSKVRSCKKTHLG